MENYGKITLLFNLFLLPFGSCFASKWSQQKWPEKPSMNPLKALKNGLLWTTTKNTSSQSDSIMLFQSHQSRHTVCQDTRRAPNPRILPGNLPDVELKNKGTLSATMPKLPPKVYILPNNEIPSKENFGFLAKTIHSPKCKTTLHPQKKQKLFTRHCKVTNLWVSGDKEIIKSNRLEMKHPSSWPSCGTGRMLGAYPNPLGVGAVPDWDIGSAKVSTSC